MSEDDGENREVSILGTGTRRRRARPSPLTVAFSLLVAAAAGYLVLYMFGGYFYIPTSLALGTGVAVFIYRSRGLRRLLPAPHGEGREMVIGPDRMAKTGLLMIGGGIGLVIVPLMTGFFLPVIFFVLYLALPLGIALSEVLQFVWISRIEARAGAEIYSVREPTELDGRDALLDRVVLTPNEKHADLG